MDLKPTKPLSGFVELMPIQQRCFDECARRMQNVLKTSGFTHLDLPAIERAEVLTDKDNWDEIETQMFLFQKGDTKMGLRYDGTVGLARFIAGNAGGLTFPMRTWMFGRNYRGERPQRGRYREFYQMDMDIMGIGTLSENYDAEIVAVMSNAYESIREFVGGTTVRVGSRVFWNAMFEYMDLSPELARKAFVLIDKKDKLDDFVGALAQEIGVKSAAEIEQVFTKGYNTFANASEKLGIAVAQLENFLAQLKILGIKNAKIDLGIMRGHGYYTGIVFEFFLDNFPEMSAVGGGGRYDNLVSKFSKNNIIGVGAAVGFSRMMVALMDENKIDLSQFENPVEVAVLIMGQTNVPFAMSVLADLRDSGIVSVPYLDSDKKFKNQIEFANKINAKFSAIIGDDESKDKKIALKNMQTGDQELLSINEVIKSVKGK